MNFKIGDKVRVREDLSINTFYGDYWTDCRMEKYKGQVGVIKLVDEEEEYYKVLIDGNKESLAWYWTDEMLEPYNEINNIEPNTIKFAKVKSNAIIPSKKEEDAGYDIYACFDEDFIIIEPHVIKMIPTGIASAFSEDYVMVLKERGSTGTKGMAIRCSIVDSGYRGEWFVPINNTTDNFIIISKIGRNELKELKLDDLIPLNSTTTVYPYSKAIGQALLLPVPKVKVKEVSYEDLKEIESSRGTGALGSSGK
ncbi:MAG: hypothetical protein ACLR02_10145 [Clostridium sp.]